MAVYTGTAGNDTINGTTGIDTISGGKGNDSLNGGSGNDTYIFNLGDGYDTIYDVGGIYVNNVLRLGQGITKDNIILSKIANDLVITFTNNTADKITVKNQFSTTSTVISTIYFSNNEVLYYSTNPLNITGTAGNDSIVGTTYTDSIVGGDGNDTITDSSANGIKNYLQGGKGNDSISGGNGDETWSAPHD